MAIGQCGDLHQHLGIVQFVRVVGGGNFLFQIMDWAGLWTGWCWDHEEISSSMSWLLQSCSWQDSVRLTCFLTFCLCDQVFCISLHLSTRLSVIASLPFFDIFFLIMFSLLAFCDLFLLKNIFRQYYHVELSFICVNFIIQYVTLSNMFILSLLYYLGCFLLLFG